MSAIAEIQLAIMALPESEYLELRKWFAGLDWEQWDREIEADSQAGRLDFLVAEAFEARDNGTLQEL
jgi:hypothetical protein